jgi:hypothetical protein
MRMWKMAIALVSATIGLAVLVGGASAGRLSTSSQTARDGFSAVSFRGGFGVDACPVTVEGSFHSRTISKVGGTLMGYLTRIALGTCTQGSATVLTETLPWHTRYSSFTGSLPAISSVILRVVGVSFAIREPVFGITCLARGTEAAPTIATFRRDAGGTLTTSTVNGSIPTNCGTEGEISGTSNSFTVLNSSTRITVTLI